MSEGVVDHTIHKEFGCLTRLFRLAKRRGCYPGDIDALRPLDLHASYAPRKRALTTQELTRLLAALEPGRAAVVASDHGRTFTAISPPHAVGLASPTARAEAQLAKVPIILALPGASDLPSETRHGRDSASATVAEEPMIPEVLLRAPRDSNTRPPDSKSGALSS